MANLLQTVVLKMLKEKYNAYAINIIHGSTSGIPDIIACIEGRFYVFEIKYGKDVVSELQKQHINKIIESGGRAHIITSTNQLCNILDNDLNPIILKQRSEVFKL